MIAPPGCRIPEPGSNRAARRRGYVSNVLSKLQLADRTQAAVYAWREGLMKRDA